MDKQAADAARLFIGIPVPRQLLPRLQMITADYQPYITRLVPATNLHLTLVWIGKVINYRLYLHQLAKKILSGAVLRIHIRQVGRGRKHRQLWAYVDVSSTLSNARLQVIRFLRRARLPLPKDIQREFVPHIRLANLSPKHLPAHLFYRQTNIKFSVHEALLLRSVATASGVRYCREATIAL